MATRKTRPMWNEKTHKVVEVPVGALRRNMRPDPAAKQSKQVPAAAQSSMRRFVLVRDQDVSGTSGTGIVAEGVEFSNGQCAVHWLSQLETVTVCANVRVIERLHGHDGRTKLRWEGA